MLAIGSHCYVSAISSMHERNIGAVIFKGEQFG